MSDWSRNTPLRRSRRDARPTLPSNRSPVPGNRRTAEARCGRHRRIELVEEFALRLDLRPPLVAIDGHGCGDVLGREIEARKVEVAVARYGSDDRLAGSRLAMRAREDPLQDTHVLAEAR